MELQDLLREIGLTKGEAKVYLALLKLGTSSVHTLKDETKLHRTNIYDFIEQLINRGLVNYHVQKNVRLFTAVDPEKLAEYLQEKKETIMDYLPEFKKMQNQEKQEIKVEVYKGKEGIKTFFNDLLRVGKNYIGFGFDEEMWEKDFSLLIKQQFRKEKEIGIKARILTSENAKMIYKHGHYKYVANEFFAPSPTTTYGDRVCTIVWNPLTVIIMTNKDVAEGHRKYFEIVWKIAKDKPKRKVKVIE